MSRKPDVLAAAPALPATSIDFNKFHDAIAAGKTAEEAIAKADLTPAPEPEQPDPAGGATQAEPASETAE